jgi:short-subunit dehydrogenase involved in D-alanine esterification of teichoic acids
MFKHDLLAGKRVLVTGGGTGLGRSITQRYLSLGARVVICGRREDVLKKTELQVLNIGANLCAIVAAIAS